MSASKPPARGWRFAGAALLVFEALWWAGNASILAIGAVGLSATADAMTIVPVGLMFVSLLAVFLLIQAPRAGIWVGLVLQAIVVIHGIVLLFPFASLVGAFEIPLGVGTALCLAAAANEMRRRRE